MKKVMIVLLSITIIAGQLYSQKMLKIGEVQDGKLKITNEKALNAYFLNCLGYSGLPGKDIKIESSPSGDRFYVTTSVSGNKDQVTSIGVLLVNKDGDVVIMEASRDGGDSPGPGIGGSMNVQCVGAPCEICFPDLEWVQGQWYPLVRCQCFDPAGKCNSVVSFTINLNVGF
jgi:hypothetical protein